MQTTLNQIRKHSPCSEGWAKLLRTLNKTAADDDPLSIITIIDSNGLDDALWCLRAVKDQDLEILLYEVWCARQVQHLMTDPRSISALDVAERFANGEATEQDLAASRAAAWEASRAEAGDAAWAVAVAAAGAETRAAAWEPSRAEVGAVAWAVAVAAAGAAARAAARAAEWEASRAEVGAVAWAVAGAAEGAAARAVAWAVARSEQEKRLREICARIDTMVPT